MSENGRGQLLKHKANGVYTPTTEPLSPRWSFLLAVTGFAMTVGTGIPVGYNIGSMNSPSEFMKVWCTESILNKYSFQLNEDQLNLVWSTIISIFLVGGCAGSLTAAKLADKFGRKGAMFCCASLFSIGGFLLYFSRVIMSVEVMLLARFIVGIASGTTTAVLGMYLAEIAPSELRGTLATLSALGVTAGVVVAQVVTLQQLLGTEDLWHYALGFYVILIVICFLPYPWFPESPKYLFIVRNDADAARKELLRLRPGDGGEEHLNQIDAEILAMEEEARTQSETRSLLSVLTDKQLLLPVILVCALPAGQQLSGVNAIFIYSVEIFKTAGFSSDNAKLANLGVGILNLMVALAGPKIMEKFNRRPTFLLSVLFSGFFLVIVTFFYINVKSVSWFSIACVLSVLGYISVFQIGLGPLPYFIGSELFEISTRPAAMALSSLASWSGNFIVGISFPTISGILEGYVFLPFAVQCFLLFAFCYRYLPESRGKEPAELAPMMSKGFKSKCH